MKRSLPIEIFFSGQRKIFPWAGRKFFLPRAYIRKRAGHLPIVKVFSPSYLVEWNISLWCILNYNRDLRAKKRRLFHKADRDGRLANSNGKLLTWCHILWFHEPIDDRVAQSLSVLAERCTSNGIPSVCVDIPLFECNVPCLSGFFCKFTVNSEYDKAFIRILLQIYSKFRFGLSHAQCMAPPTLAAL